MKQVLAILILLLVSNASAQEWCNETNVIECADYNAFYDATGHFDGTFNLKRAKCRVPTKPFKFWMELKSPDEYWYPNEENKLAGKTSLGKMSGVQYQSYETDDFEPVSTFIVSNHDTRDYLYFKGCTAYRTISWKYTNKNIIRATFNFDIDCYGVNLCNAEFKGILKYSKRKPKRG